MPLKQSDVVTVSAVGAVVVGLTAFVFITRFLGEGIQATVGGLPTESSWNPVRNFKNMALHPFSPSTGYLISMLIPLFFGAAAYGLLYYSLLDDWNPSQRSAATFMFAVWGALVGVAFGSMIVSLTKWHPGTIFVFLLIFMAGSALGAYYGIDQLKSNSSLVSSSDK
jgi:hypothetical protein